MCSQDRPCIENETRKLILDILSRLPTTDTMRPYAGRMLALGMLVLRSDAEDTAILGLRLVMDIYKAHRELDASSAGAAVKDLLEFSENAFESLPTVAAGLLGCDLERPDDLPAIGGAGTASANKGPEAPAEAQSAMADDSPQDASSSPANEAATGASGGVAERSVDDGTPEVPCASIHVPDETRERLRDVALGVRVLRPGESL